jgi:hypothetical protein
MPDISINNSFLTERARDYAALSDLAYADWSYNGKEWVPNSGYKQLWDEMKEKGYSFVNQKRNVNATGYSGTLFGYKGIQILANRGTELLPPDPMDTVGEIGDAPHICRFAFRDCMKRS